MIGLHVLPPGFLNQLYAIPIYIAKCHSPTSSVWTPLTIIFATPIPADAWRADMLGQYGRERAVLYAIIAALLEINNL